jgi:hypothetical protein
MMRKLFFVFALLSSMSAFAFMNDVECDGRMNNGDLIRVEIERNFGGGMRDARVTIFGDRGTNPTEERFFVYNARRFGTSIDFTGSQGFRLSVDVWPDQTPRWGRTYRGEYNRSVRNMTCRFPNAPF